VKIPAGFSRAEVWMLSAEPKTAATHLKATAVLLAGERRGGAVAFEVPDLILCRVVVVEFEK
jgi:hypothetical protein